MTQKKRFGWVLKALRYVFLAAAVAFLVHAVKWEGRITLKTGETYHVIRENTDDNTYEISRDGEIQTITNDDVMVDAETGVLNYQMGLGQVVKTVDWKLTVFALLIFAPAWLIQSLRLKWMLAVQNIRLSYIMCVKLTYAGNFFNFALPGSTGGDVFKAYYITKHTHHKTEAVMAVFLDRVIGMVGIFTLAAVMTLLSPTRFPGLVPAIITIGVALGVGTVVIFSQRLRELFRFRQLAEKLPFSTHILRVGRAAIALRQHKKLLFAAFFSTLTLQLIVYMSLYAMSHALSMKGDLWDYLLAFPIGFLAAAIPVTPQGFGVMEAVYIKFFEVLGNARSQALALALCARLIQFVWALPGVLVPLLGAHMPKASEIEKFENADDPGDNVDMPDEGTDDPSSSVVA